MSDTDSIARLGRAVAVTLIAATPPTTSADASCMPANTGLSAVPGRSPAGEVGIAAVITFARLVAYAINDHDRWRRFLLLVFLSLAVAAGWWLVADGGVHILFRDFSPATITRPQ